MLCYLVLVVVFPPHLLEFLLQRPLLLGQPQLMHVPHVCRALAVLEQRLQLPCLLQGVLLQTLLEMHRRGRGNAQSTPSKHLLTSIVQATQPYSSCC
jgi:hypothetical protein